MLSHCANPQCSKPFLRLGEGKLFLVETEDAAKSRELSIPSSPRRPPRRVERYWLCDRCAENSTLIHDRHRGVAIVPRPVAPEVKTASAKASGPTGSA
jgi:hypothetical protein